MEKINFVNNTQPYINDTNLNLLQTNVENAINDAKSTVKNEILQGEVYSTNEIKTNKVWTDGKPIYTKVLEFTFITGNTIDLPSDVDTLVNMYGISAGRPLPAFYFSSYWQSIRETNHVLYLSCSAVYSGDTAHLTIEYTKTTD